MEDRLYAVKLLFTKLSPPATHGFLPKIGRKKLLERLKKYGSEKGGKREKEVRFCAW